MRKKILFIIESSETGGAESIFSELVTRIENTDYEAHVALLKEGWLLEKLLDLGVSPHLIPTRKGGVDLPLLYGLGRLISSLEVDLVHSHLFTTNVYSSAINMLKRVPVISTFHGTMDVAKNDRFNKIKWMIVNSRSKKVVYVSNYLRDFFIQQRLGVQKNSCVVYNGINVERFCNGLDKGTARQRLGLTESSFVIGCVGDLRPAKDYPSALRAVAILKNEIPDLHLVIAGTTTDLLNDLTKLAADLGIETSVRFIGFQDQIENVLPAFDVYLSSSVSEGFSLTVVEALAAGLPVVATCSGGPEEIIQHSVSGLLVDVASPEGIAEAIRSLFVSPEKVHEFRNAGLRLVEKKFSIEAMMQNYLALYNEVTENVSDS